MVTKLIGVRIKELRAEAGITQEALALRTGIARSYPAEVETGKRNLSMRNMLKVANGLGVTLGHFFDSPLFDQLYPAPVAARARRTREHVEYATAKLKEAQSTASVASMEEQAEREAARAARAGRTGSTAAGQTRPTAAQRADSTKASRDPAIPDPSEYWWLRAPL